MLKSLQKVPIYLWHFWSIFAFDKSSSMLVEVDRQLICSNLKFVKFELLLVNIVNIFFPVQAIA